MRVHIGSTATHTEARSSAATYAHSAVTPSEDFSQSAKKLLDSPLAVWDTGKVRLLTYRGTAARASQDGALFPFRPRLRTSQARPANLVLMLGTATGYRGTATRQRTARQSGRKRT